MLLVNMLMLAGELKLVQACTLVANVVFLLSQHDCHVFCWAHVESRRLISLVGWDRCNLLVLSVKKFSVVLFTSADACMATWPHQLACACFVALLDPIFQRPRTGRYIYVVWGARSWEDGI